MVLSWITHRVAGQATFVLEFGAYAEKAKEWATVLSGTFSRDDENVVVVFAPDLVARLDFQPETVFLENSFVIYYKILYLLSQQTKSLLVLWTLQVIVAFLCWLREDWYSAIK